MAITAILSPDTLVSTGCPAIFRVTTNSTDITTEIQCKVFFRRRPDDFFRIAATKQRAKEAGYSYYEFNVTSVLANLLSQDYKTGSTGLSTNAENCAIEYVVYFAEWYPSSAFVKQATLTTASFYACNTNLYHTETQSVFTGSDWYMDGVASHKFLTDSPSSQYIRASERIQLDFLTSYTDPCVRVRETKNDLSTNTVEYELPNTTYNTYLWDWGVDADEVVTIETPELYTIATYIEANNGTYGYMPDNLNNMWGGVILTDNNDTVDIILPVLGVASATVVINHIAKTANNDFQIWYYYSAAWNASPLNPQTASTAGYTDFTETLPANTTKLRIKKISATGIIWIPYGYVSWVDDNAQNKRCQFTLDTTHIDTDTKTLQIWALATTGGSTISETKAYTVDAETQYEDTTRFAVRNKRGGFDHFTYTQTHSEILTAEKTRATKELPNTFTTKDRGTGVTQVTSEKIFTCYSKFIEDTELQWWATIVESKEVFVIVSDIQYAVDIVTDTVITYTHTDLVQLKIDWTYAVKR